MRSLRLAEGDALPAGSAGGLSRNFTTLVDILGEFAEVTEPQVAAAAPQVAVSNLFCQGAGHACCGSVTHMF